MCRVVWGRAVVGGKGVLCYSGSVVGLYRAWVVGCFGADRVVAWLRDTELLWYSTLCICGKERRRERHTIILVET